MDWRFSQSTDEQLRQPLERLILIVVRSSRAVQSDSLSRRRPRRLGPRSPLDIATAAARKTARLASRPSPTTRSRSSHDHAVDGAEREPTCRSGFALGPTGPWLPRVAVMASSVCVLAVSRMRPPRTCSVASRELWCLRSVVPARRATTVWRSARSWPLCRVCALRPWSAGRACSIWARAASAERRRVRQRRHFPVSSSRGAGVSRGDTANH